MSTKSEEHVTEEAQIDHITGVDESLKPKTDKDRTVSSVTYMFMWLGDGVNLGNMTLGASIVVAGIATLNMVQTFAAALLAILIITTIFTLNDRLGYKSGIPYVVQLRMSFGEKGSIISSLMRGIPAIVWYGFQSWIGGTALNEIMKIVTDGAFNNIFICFLILQAVQIVLSLYGFHAVKWVETLVSVVIMLALIYVFVVLLTSHRDVITENWVQAEGSWGLPFFGFVMVFMGNYAAIFLSAADYSRELKTGMSDKKRGLLYFFSILVAYGSVISIGVMLASATGITNPAKAIPVVIDSPAISIFISAFIVVGAVAVNMVANIIPPTYVITSLTKLKYKPAVTLTGILAIGSFPWLLVQESNAEGLGLFILVYSAFLGPIVSILLVEYYILRKQKVNIAAMYKKDGPFAGYNPSAILALLIGAGAAFIEVDLAWIVGFVVGGIAYFLLMKFAFKDSKFKKGTIFEK
ncbi:NCS1 family transporter [Virgibacillus necropolis]|uniref:Allantoin permease n=1 Tax=Virgibacillus necropolis TaxID=163877 RepID=A0A221MGK2_9BACI|nr:NCS1 family transporter [Virgibacillus necropolis]ASN06742.1 allantoin permease [Virgibacillus necropolis]